MTRATWCGNGMHTRRGIVSNQEPTGRFDATRALMRLTVCGEADCIQRARERVRFVTREMGVFHPDRVNEVAP